MLGRHSRRLLCSLHRGACPTYGQKPTQFLTVGNRLIKFAATAVPSTTESLPAHLDGRSAAYLRWRDDRIARIEQSGATIVNLSATEPDKTAQSNRLHQLCRRVADDGFCLYRFESLQSTDTAEEESLARQSVLSLSRALQLINTDRGVVTDDEALSLLKDHAGSSLGRFPPYSSRALNWHTDGYYNQIDQPVRTFLLHCLSSARAGGELTLLDPELLLIRLHDTSPDIANLLSSADAITLPANVDEEGHNRPGREVPVFYCHEDGSLGMRFTTRQSNISFKSSAIEQAMSEVNTAIDHCASWYAQVCLQPGEGLIARNLLHKRAPFEDAPDGEPRKILRSRYLDKLQTGV